jgi:hypothetical protein
MQPVIPYESTPEHGGYVTGSPPAALTWRWETTCSLVCVLLFGGWLWLTDGSPSGFGQVLLAVLLGAGIGLAVSGCRRGNLGSRRAARLALAFHLVITALSVGYAIWVWWFDGW